MKFIRKIAGIAAIAATLVACDKGEEKVIGSKGEQVKLEDIDFQNASVTFYGEYVEGLSNYSIMLYNGDVDEDGYIVGDADILCIDLYASKTSTADALPTGTFKCVSESNLAEGTFCEGREMSILEYYQPYIDAGLITLKELLEEYTTAELGEPSGNYNGSEYYNQKLDGVDEDGEDNYLYADFPLTADSGSTVKISKTSDGKYSIKVIACFENTDVEYTYTGEIEIYDDSSDDSGDDDDDSGEVSDRSGYTVTTFSSFTQAEADYCGSEDGYYYWAVFVADNNIDLDDLSGTGKLLTMELVTTKSGKTALPEGEYIIEATSGDYVAFGFYTDSNGYACGTNYWVGDDLVNGSTAGSIKVSKTSSGYKFEATLYDDDEEATFQGTYSGKVAVLDYSESSATSEATPSAAKAKAKHPSAAKAKKAQVRSVSLPEHRSLKRVAK